MNTIQLAQRLARHLNVRDATSLEAEPALDVLSAMNAGIAEFYAHAPALYRRTTLSHTLRAPQSLAVNFAAQYGNAVSTGTFTDAMLGCTLRFESGVADTLITGTNSVLDNFLGTTLAQAGTVYSDAVPLQDVIERIVGHVRIYDNTRQTPSVLARDERLRGGRGIWGRGDSEMPNYWRGELNETGRPRYYYLEPVGASQGAEPEFLLRVAPMPEVDYTIRLEAELGPRQITFAQLSTATKVSVPESRIETVLIPLCEAALSSSSFWRNAATAGGVMARAEMVLREKMGMVPVEIAPMRNRVGTPCGY